MRVTLTGMYAAFANGQRRSESNGGRRIPDAADSRQP